jgi:hypothetical protein
MRLLSDNPTTDDLLGFQVLADFAAGVIVDRPDLPFTIGVFGEWGSGKTTLMKMVERRLEDPIKTVWFNAWKYDGKEVLWNALIQQIFYAMLTDPAIAAAEHASQFKSRVKEAAKELAAYAAKVAIRVVPGGLLRDEDVDAVVRILSSSADSPGFNFVNQFERTFDELVHDFVGDGCLVIFIDDLDRCLPENAITVMEALKLYLDRANCVFVVGVEPNVIEEAIRQRYRDNPRLSATAYLEKIVQLPIVVPRAKTSAALALLESAPYPLSSDDELLREVVKRGTDCNPRRVKRFVNAFAVASATAPSTFSLSEQRAFAKVLSLQMAFPEFYRALAGRSHLLKKVEKGFRERPGDGGAVATEPDVGRFSADFALGRFLEKTKEIPLAPKEIRRWSRVAGVVSGDETDGLDESDEEFLDA